jgi:hypothetical protein
LDELTSVQISEWEAYDKIDPIGTWRDDFRMANLAAIITNIVNCLYSKKGSQPKLTTPLDFMPDWSNDKKEVSIKQSPEEMKEFLLRFAKIHNKKIESLKTNRVPKQTRKKRNDEHRNNDSNHRG